MFPSALLWATVVGPSLAVRLFFCNKKSENSDHKGDVSVLHIPPFTESRDLDQCLSVIRDNSFATLITTIVVNGNEPLLYTSTVPFALKKNSCDTSAGEPTYSLQFHLGKANPHCQLLASGATGSMKHLILFNGPHAYISPKTYPETIQSKSVPTWNYVQVQVESKSVVDVLNEQQLIASVSDLTDIYEQKRVRSIGAAHAEAYEFLDNEKVDPAYKNGLLKGIIGFEIKCDHIKGKFKLSQNKSQEAIQQVIKGLKATSEYETTASMNVAEWMEKVSVKDFSS